jgi:hypothetical protein
MAERMSTNRALHQLVVFGLLDRGYSAKQRGPFHGGRSEPYSDWCP